MESMRTKRRSSFSKSSKILASFYKTASNHQHSIVKPGPLADNSSPKTLIPPASGPPPITPGFIIVNKDPLIYPQQPPKVAFVVPDRNRHDSCAKLESFYEDDEAVDAKAAKYITAVRERFRSA